MDWQWLITAALIPATLALWEIGKGLVKRWGEVKIAQVEAEAKASLEHQKDEREHKQKRESLELATVLGNQSFKDEQITAMAAEAQAETGAYSQFFRDQYAHLIGQMVTQVELEEVKEVQEKLLKQVVTIDTYLRSIIQELRNDRDRMRRESEDKDFEIISGLQEEIAALKAQLGPKN